MKRFERRRVERVRRIALMIGLSFALGALIDTALTWRLHEFDLDAGEAVAAVGAIPTTVTTVPVPAPVATTGIVPRGAEVDLLKRRGLELPVEGIKPSALVDTFSDGRALGRPHEAIDIMAPKGTPVLAVEDGTVAKLFRSVAGGITIYQFDPSGMFAYYYAHLDSYARGVAEGQPVRRGQTIGYVGSTGNASDNAPHLHFAIFRLTPEHQWWKGDAINPYPVLR
jgi:murein DD-endopeptidase MepM/ murein hydrolase activator NlpD